jgi:ParB family chromosome partitioning protein
MQDSDSPSNATAPPASSSLSPAPTTSSRRGPLSLPINSLAPPTDPHRQAIDAERVVALAQDIAANGLINPIQVRGPLPDGLYEIIAGHRRTLALRYLRHQTIDAFVYAVDVDVLDLRASENLLQESLDVIEQAQIAARYREQGMPLAGIAAKMAHSQPWVRSRLDLLDYPAEVRDAIARGDIPMSVAGALVEIEHEGVRRTYLDEAVRTGATRKTVDVWLAHWRADGARLAANHTGVEAIIHERETYRISVVCEGCQQAVDITATRSLRFCARCMEEVAAAART